MNTGRFTLALLAAGLAIGAAASTASADVADGQSSVSANWSGYRVASQNGDAFSKVSGSWVEPSAKCDSGQSHASFWVGLGGSGDGNGALEQTGTAVDCNSSGTADHYAWYELLPAAPVQLDLTISPGDHMSSSVAVNGTSVTINVADQTTGKSVTKTLQMNDPDVSTAEWIAEAPSTCDGSGDCQPLTLANFGTVAFSNASATAAGHTGTISDGSWSAQPVALSPDAGRGAPARSDSSATSPAARRWRCAALIALERWFVLLGELRREPRLDRHRRSRHGHRRPLGRCGSDRRLRPVREWWLRLVG